MHQRAAYKKLKDGKERAEQLRKIGFNFTIREKAISDEDDGQGLYVILPKKKKTDIATNSYKFKCEFKTVMKMMDKVYVPFYQRGRKSRQSHSR